LYEKNNSLSSFHFLKNAKEKWWDQRNLHQLKLFNHEKDLTLLAAFVMARVNSQHLYGPGSKR
jgi:hypothetical protein